MLNITLNLILFVSSAFILASCGSSARFTNDSNDKGPRDNSSLRVFTGIASYYSDEYHGRKTANGETYDMYKLTAAHRDIPFNTIARITNLKNNKTVSVRINDRMPDFKNRIIDLSYGAARQIDMIRDGIIEVRIEILQWGK